MRLFAPDDGMDKRMRKRIRMYCPTQAAASDIPTACISHRRRLRLSSEPDVFFRMIRGADQRTALYGRESFFFAYLFILLELPGSDVCRYGIMLPAWLEILTDSQILHPHASRSTND